MTYNVNNSIAAEDVVNRFPEVQEIANREVRQLTIDVIEDLCPDYFWELPASSSGKYHPVDHRDAKGLWLHTKRAYTQYDRLAPSFEQQGRINKIENDYGRSAILLHDMFKYGWPEHNHTVKDHDVIAADQLREYGDVPEEIIGCVETHNGPWYAGPSPRNDLELLHHSADMAASDVNNPNIAVLKPCRELEKQFPNVNVSNK